MFYSFISEYIRPEVLNGTKVNFPSCAVTLTRHQHQLSCTGIILLGHPFSDDPLQGRPELTGPKALVTIRVTHQQLLNEQLPCRDERVIWFGH